MLYKSHTIKQIYRSYASLINPSFLYYFTCCLHFYRTFCKSFIDITSPLAANIVTTTLRYPPTRSDSTNTIGKSCLCCAYSKCKSYEASTALLAWNFLIAFAYQFRAFQLDSQHIRQLCIKTHTHYTISTQQTQANNIHIKLRWMWWWGLRVSAAGCFAISGLEFIPALYLGRIIKYDRHKHVRMHTIICE